MIKNSVKETAKIEGIKEGREEKEIESILGFYKKGISTTIISEALSMAEERV